ncbi:Hypothetical predicted protein [Pelobates cultripes]|uniref:Uncharacterized protein n=1 Tax=Pelobates cultripes TaxID=61616 RepID=A0AAD1S428_PELCU|nr:Hypothetical predicted protein [Pelobates cultripes]
MKATEYAVAFADWTLYSPPSKAELPPLMMGCTKPKTQTDILDLYDCIRKLLDADIALLKEEVWAISEWVRVAEEDVSDLKRGLSSLEETVHNLQSSNTNTNLRVDSCEDRDRRKNLKIRGVSDTVASEELPHLNSRLLASELPTKMAKWIVLDGVYRIAKSPRALTVSPRDIMVRFQSCADKQKLLNAIRDKAPVHFETHHLTFYQDLTRSTLQWRQAMRPINRRLRTYRWSTPRALIAYAEDKTYRAVAPKEATTFLASLGVTDTPPENQKPQSGHSWDVSNITPFVPARGQNYVTI